MSKDSVNNTLSRLAGRLRWLSGREKQNLGQVLEKGEHMYPEKRGEQWPSEGLFVGRESKQ